MASIDELLSRLEGVKLSSSGWTAHCPAHDDQNPSLSIREGTDGRALLHCHAGCSYSEILTALGARSGNFDNRLNADQAAAQLANRGLRPQTIRYFKIKANIEKQAWEFRLGKRRGTKYKAFNPDNGTAKYWVEPGTNHTVYHLEPCRGKDEIWLVEGEPDVWIMHQAGLPACSFTGGAENIPRAAIREIAEAGVGTVNIVYDNDEAGRTGANKVAAALEAADVQVIIRSLPSSVGPSGDVTTLYNNLGCDDCSFLREMRNLPMNRCDLGDRTTPLVASDASVATQRSAGLPLVFSLRDTARPCDWRLRRASARAPDLWRPNRSRISVRVIPSGVRLRHLRTSSAMGSPRESPKMKWTEASAYSQSASAALRCGGVTILLPSISAYRQDSRVTWASALEVIAPRRPG